MVSTSRTHLASGAGVSEAGVCKEAAALAPRSSAKLTSNASNMMMDPEYMTMMLAMDTLWASEDVQDAPPSDAVSSPSDSAA